MTTEIAVKEPPSIINDMAMRFGMDKRAFESTLKATVVPANVSNEQFVAFLLVAKQYNLNPITKEIYAFPAKGGGIQPIVGIDGWCNIINSNPQLDGIEFEDVMTDGKLTAITCKIYRKDRSKPTEATEYMEECKRSTEPWNKWPARMLRHKALIQCARYAFSLSGIVDPDEAERMVDITPSNVDPVTGGQRGNSPFKNATLRNTFVKEVQVSLQGAKNVDEVNFIMGRNAVKFEAMRAGGDSRDELSLESIENIKELVIKRLSDTLTEIEPEDEFSPEEQARMEEQYGIGSRQ